jgi:hypothetical protein
MIAARRRYFSVIEMQVYLNVNGEVTERYLSVNKSAVALSAPQHVILITIFFRRD